MERIVSKGDEQDRYVRLPGEMGYPGSVGPGISFRSLSAVHNLNDSFMTGCENVNSGINIQILKLHSGQLISSRSILSLVIKF